MPTEVTIDDSLVTTHEQRSMCGRGTVWKNQSTGYTFGIDSDVDFGYWKSTNNGNSWGAHQSIRLDDVRGWSIWYEGWTPGNTGDIVHLVYADDDTNRVYYRQLDLSNDSLGTEIELGGTNVAVWDEYLDIIELRNGDILCAGYWRALDGQEGVFRSTDGGSSFSKLSDPFGTYDGNRDPVLLCPGDETATEDCWMVVWDTSASEIKLYVWDGTGSGSWDSGTSIATSMDPTSATNPEYVQMDGVQRHSDRHLILAAWSEINSSTADLKVWDIGGTGSITAKTNVLTNTDNCACCRVWIDQDTDDIRVYYFKGGTWEASVDLYYKESTDGGTNWGTETKVNTTQDDLRWLTTPHMLLSSTGQKEPVWWNDDLSDLLTNEGVAGAAAPAAVMPAGF